ELRQVAAERAMNRRHELFVERVSGAGQTADVASPLPLAVVLPGFLAVFLDEGFVPDRERDGSVVLRELAQLELKDPPTIQPVTAAAGDGGGVWILRRVDLLRPVDGRRLPPAGVKPGRSSHDVTEAGVHRRSHLLRVLPRIALVQRVENAETDCVA